MLTEGGDRIDVENLVDWKSTNTLLKASFPFAAANQKATYDLGLGTIQRGNNTAEHYEVPAQKWADLTNESGAYGVAILNDSKYGWDKPADNVLRLTLLHTAKARAYPYQSSNDLGHHRFVYSLAGHRGDWRTGRVPIRAAALNQPPIAFQTDAHVGMLGRVLSVLSLTDPNNQVAISALKKAEDSDEFVVRVQELYGRPAQTRIKFAWPIRSVREINAAEEEVGRLPAQKTSLAIELKPYQPRTFAVRLRTSISAWPQHPAVPMNLPYNLDGVSTDANRADGNFDGKGQTLAGELLPRELTLAGRSFHLGAIVPGTMNVLVPQGQTMWLPQGSFDRLYILAAAVGGDVTTTIAGQTIRVREWQGPVGQWDSRLKEPRQLREVQVAPMTRGQTWTNEPISREQSEAMRNCTSLSVFDIP